MEETNKIEVFAGNGTRFILTVLEKIGTGLSVEVSCPSSKFEIVIPVASEELEAWSAITSEQIKDDTACLADDDKWDYYEYGPGQEAGAICIKSGEGGYVVFPDGLRGED